MTDHLTRSYEAREDEASRRGDAIERRLSEILEDSIDVAESVFARLARRNDPYADLIATAVAEYVKIKPGLPFDRRKDLWYSIAGAMVAAWQAECERRAEADVLADEERERE